MKYGVIWKLIKTPQIEESIPNESYDDDFVEDSMKEH